MPDCNIRKWETKRGWQEQWTMVQSEASAFLHSSSVQFLLMFGPVLHSFYLLPQRPFTLLKKDTGLTYFCTWLHCCVFLLVWIDFIFDTWYVYHLCLYFEFFFDFCPRIVFINLFIHLLLHLLLFLGPVWGRMFCYPKPFRKSLWKLMWLWNMRDWPEINSVWFDGVIHILSWAAHASINISYSVDLTQV